MEPKQAAFQGFASPAPPTFEFSLEPTTRQPTPGPRASSPVTPHFNITTATERDILIEVWNQIHLT